MDKEIATKVFESLASGIRLDVWRLLVKAGLEGQVAGQLASELDIAPNTHGKHYLYQCIEKYTGKEWSHILKSSGCLKPMMMSRDAPSEMGSLTLSLTGHLR